MDKYFEFLDKGCQYDYSHDIRKRLSRAHTFIKVINEIILDLYTSHPIIIELGTTRSYVNGGLEGCMSYDKKYWKLDNPESWDWGAGCFTRVFAEILPNSFIHTVDINSNHIEVCRTITKEFQNVMYHVSDSAIFLQNMEEPADLIYMDVGDVTPLEESAMLHKRDAEVIIRNNLVKVGGYVLIDDVRCPVPIVEYGEKSCFGKAKYSIGVFLANGFDIIEDQYQMLLKRMR
jgi:hypothetical protein